MPYKDAKKQKEAQRRYYEENKDKYLARHQNRASRLKLYLEDFKSGKKCLDCEIAYPHYMMDFDHVRGRKRFEVSSIRSFSSIEDLQIEIDKCDLICSNCHRHRTWMRQVGSPHPHGRSATGVAPRLETGQG